MPVTQQLLIQVAYQLLIQVTFFGLITMPVIHLSFKRHAYFTIEEVSEQKTPLKP
jgi:hypothetical protein